MCSFCEAREEEIKRGNEVLCQIYVIDEKNETSYKYLLDVLKYCPNCGKNLREE